MEPPPAVEHVLLYATLRPGSLVLAECADGSLQILRDDRPVEGSGWEPHETPTAAAAFHRMVAQLEGKGN